MKLVVKGSTCFLDESQSIPVLLSQSMRNILITIRVVRVWIVTGYFFLKKQALVKVIGILNIQDIF